jgi:hypothetical protein
VSGVYPFSVHSWNDLYQILRAKAEATRGLCSVDIANRSSFPRTTIKDAFAIVIVFDEAVYEKCSTDFIMRWISESDLLIGEPEDSTDFYVGNRSLWDTLAAGAIELDQAQAALPSPKLIDAALRELSIKHCQPTRSRNGSGSPIVTVFTEPTWKAMAIRQLDFFRALRGEVRGPKSVTSVPATRNADVALLADYWTGQIERHGEDARDTFHRLLYSAWREVVHNVKHAESLPPADTYERNFEFWSALLLLATQSDACNAAPSPWSFDVPAMVDRGPMHNQIVGEDEVMLEFPTTATWEEQAKLQRDAFSKLRGEDLVTGRLIAHVPRTTVDDVRQIAEFWVGALARAGSLAKGSPLYRHAVDRWKSALAQLDALPSVLNRRASYPHNADFWEALMTIAVEAMASAPARNASAVETDGTLEFPSTATWDEQAKLQRDAFSKLRGEDIVTGRLISRVPRTTVADVRQLAAYWASGLAKVGAHGLGDVSYRHVLDRWKAALAQVDRTPRDLDPTSVYPNNLDFWEAVMTIAIQIAVTAEAPTRWQLVKEASKTALHNLPDTLKSAAQSFVGNVLKKPLIYAGIGVGGLLLLTVLMRSSKPASLP